MRHGHGHRKLNRTSEHRKAMFQNMINSLIKHEQIQTTVPKSIQLKSIIDKLITIGKKNTLASKKTLFSRLQDKSSVAKLTTVLSKRYEKRNGGYCRVVKSGFRFGDNAPTAIIELVDRDENAKGLDSGPVIEKKPSEEEENQ